MSTRKSTDFYVKLGQYTRQLCAALLLQLRQEKQLADSQGGRVLSNIHKKYSEITQPYSIEQFADVYAQTVCYGLFYRNFLSGPATERTLNPPQQWLNNNLFIVNPFTNDYPEKIQTIIDVINQYMTEPQNKDKFKTTATDPIIHFYEHFLSAYKQQKRREMGVYYTPQSAVTFIVQSIHDNLRTHFKLPLGLASTKNWGEVKQLLEQPVSDSSLSKQPFIKILDPACGTGTFIVEIIRIIRETMKKHWVTSGQVDIQQKWHDYVYGCGEFGNCGLIDRIYGIEILTPPYLIARLRLQTLLQEDQQVPLDFTLHKSWHINLANALHQPIEKTIGNTVEKAPFTVVIGNPPYKASSQNKSPWITALMEDYKKEPLTSQKLKERNSKWINDDYVKFFRLGQYCLEKQALGIIGYITPHGYLDGPTFRGMRYKLWMDFSDLQLINLHGNIKRRKATPENSKDENIFPIQQGVCIAILLRKDQKQNYGKCSYVDVYGTQKHKEAILTNREPKLQFSSLHPNQHIHNLHLMIKSNLSHAQEYYNGFALDELFLIKSVGIVTARDAFTVSSSDQLLKQRLHSFLHLNDEEARTIFRLGKDVRDWKVRFARQDLQQNLPLHCTPIAYRPFDTRYTIYTGKSKGFHCYPRHNIMQHYLHGSNVGLMVSKQVKADRTYQHVFVHDSIAESCLLSNKTGEIGYSFPLYQVQNNTRTANLSTEICNRLANHLNTTYQTVPQDETEISPDDVFAYVYGVLHSTRYRTKYFAQLKSGFPKIPYPQSSQMFWHLVRLGTELREIHLMRKKFVPKVTFNGEGTNKITNSLSPISRTSEGRIWINNTQFFGGVPNQAWKMKIGAYQVAQKWLNDKKRQNAVIDANDIEKYIQIIEVLYRTHQITQKIDLAYQ